MASRIKNKGDPCNVLNDINGQECGGLLFCDPRNDYTCQPKLQENNYAAAKDDTDLLNCDDEDNNKCEESAGGLCTNMGIKDQDKVCVPFVLDEEKKKAYVDFINSKKKFWNHYKSTFNMDRKELDYFYYAKNTEEVPNFGGGLVKKDSKRKRKTRRLKKKVKKAKKTNRKIKKKKRRSIKRKRKRSKGRKKH